MKLQEIEGNSKFDGWILLHTAFQIRICTWLTADRSVELANQTIFLRKNVN